MEDGGGTGALAAAGLGNASTLTAGSSAGAGSGVTVGDAWAGHGIFLNIEPPGIDPIDVNHQIFSLGIVVVDDEAGPTEPAEAERRGAGEIKTPFELPTFDVIGHPPIDTSAAEAP